MATTRPGRIVLSSLAITKPEDVRMRKSIELDASLEHVAKHGKRATWLRGAIAEKCARLEAERAK